ncbi:hypothetical protein Z517_05001 [Fonsecaea pedrosoi CBS 271.37]|uniref:Unplaced genomic scaffold supercont1.3, whole genome shotgun sequence n=1 Tax=Fonsecaea pedrosoi CBS 271.37 TaxID=1442368 RepID=A0A0D2GTW2_9EURO|nr:uncharacterized protein Z517_05001 [Fonsecaea pedrosoi CBS 271.37]KIW81975.1 hypothetical protein Z517_05001 [Fonsecaea pedrosoi CBS 271.37]
MSPFNTGESAAQLRAVLALLATAVENLACEWESSPSGNGVVDANIETAVPDTSTVSHAEHDAVKTILAALGSIESLVLDPHTRLLNLSMSYLIARALHVVADHRVAELLTLNHNKPEARGVSAEDLARTTGLEQGKLCRVMRTLTSHHVFEEVEDGRFANNRISHALVGDAAFQANILLKGQLQYAASECLPQVLANPATRNSYDPRKTAFQQAVGTKLSLFDWMNETVLESEVDWRPRSRQRHPLEGDEEGQGDGDGQDGPSRPHLSGQKTVPRPEKNLFNLAISGQVRGTEKYCVLDFPWEDLPNGATVVDVGGGIGSFCMQLHAHHAHLNLVVQDKPHVIQQGLALWKTKHHSALVEGRVHLTPHDFFKKNPVVGAEIYWLRYIIHDWADDDAIAILSRVADSMTPTSRVLIAETLMRTTVPADKFRSAATPLLANYGVAMAPAHMMDLNMMMMTNGRERTPAEFDRIVQAAGMVVDRVWDCRGPLSIVDCRLA